MISEITKLTEQDARAFERQAIVAALFRICDPLRTMDNLNKGDTVQLKSGGPIMSVHDISHTGAIFCQWFDREGALKTGSFQPAQLRKADPLSPEEPPGSSSSRSY